MSEKRRKTHFHNLIFVKSLAKNDLFPDKDLDSAKDRNRMNTNPVHNIVYGYGKISQLSNVKKLRGNVPGI
jgi:hypothetical protein